MRNLRANWGYSVILDRVACDRISVIITFWVKNFGIVNLIFHYSFSSICGIFLCELNSCSPLRFCKKIIPIFSCASPLLNAGNMFGLIIRINVTSGAYELPKEHETWFHDYPNYITIFENSVYIIRGFW